MSRRYESMNQAHLYPYLSEQTSARLIIMQMFSIKNTFQNVIAKLCPFNAAYIHGRNLTEIQKGGR